MLVGFGVPQSIGLPVILAESRCVCLWVGVSAFCLWVGVSACGSVTLVTSTSDDLPPSVALPVGLSSSQSVCLSACLPVNQSACRSLILQAASLPVGPAFSRSVCLYQSSSVHQSASQPVCVVIKM